MVKLHAGMVSALNVVKQGDLEFLLTGGSDKIIKLCPIKGNKIQDACFNLTVDAMPRSVDYLNDNYLVGMANGSIVEYDSL